jgi:hypothetical protein
MECTKGKINCVHRSECRVTAYAAVVCLNRIILLNTSECSFRPDVTFWGWNLSLFMQVHRQLYRICHADGRFGEGKNVTFEIQHSYWNNTSLSFCMHRFSTCLTIHVIPDCHRVTSDASRASSSQIHTRVHLLSPADANAFYQTQ